MPGLIEDYAIIGNCESAALVGRDGSIDWLALPRFDSAACFAALLGDAENGRWQITPKGDARITRRYREIPSRRVSSDWLRSAAGPATADRNAAVHRNVSGKAGARRHLLRVSSREREQGV